MSDLSTIECSLMNIESTLSKMQKLIEALLETLQDLNNRT